MKDFKKVIKLMFLLVIIGFVVLLPMVLLPVGLSYGGLI
tara:strand:- start:463 stop:579 length:117 start_codon:yes stop_codon:yes gene_type:complete